MSFYETYEAFCKTAETLLQVMQMEEQYLKDTRIFQIDSLLEKKKALFNENEDQVSQIMQPGIWNKLEKLQQKNVNGLLKSIVLAMKQNIDLLDVAKRGNKKLVDLHFIKIRTKPAFYTSAGKLHQTAYAPSMGVRRVV